MILLSDDKVKSLDYAYRNLKYIMANMNDWVAEEDKDYTFRTTTNFAIINIKFYWYYTQLLATIGGIHQYEHFDGDNMKAYMAVPKAQQKESLIYTMSLLENLGWTYNETLAANIDAINGDASDYMRRLLFPYMLRLVANIGFAEAKDPSNSYTQEECINDIFNYVWKDTMDGKATSPEKLSMQKALVQVLISSSTVTQIPGDTRKSGAGLSDDEFAFYNMMANKSQNVGLKAAADVAAYGVDAKIAYLPTDVSHIWFGWLLENKTILEQLVAKQDGANKDVYEYLLLQINRAIKTEKL